MTDPLDVALYADGPPHALFRQLRREAPVCWQPERDGGGYWAVTRYAEVVAVSRDHATYSSWLGGTMAAEAPAEQLAMLRMMMLNMDPPQHTALRALINKGFTPRMVSQLQARIAELAAQIVDAVAPRGACDFVADVAGELPSYLIAELVGIPLDDGRRLYQLTERMHQDPSDLAAQADIGLAVGEMMAYAHGLRAAKRAAPGHDIASTLLAAEVDGARLTDLEFDLFFLLLINAGGDTTRNLVAGGMLELLQRPELLARLRADSRLLPSAIEELLRVVSPVMHFRRTSTADTTLGGATIHAGDKVVVFYVSANRDEAVFDDPDRLDIARAPNEHVAFGGGGAHFCLGANLARLEIRCLFEQVLARLPTMRLAGPVDRLRSTFINGVRSMPVEF